MCKRCKLDETDGQRVRLNSRAQAKQNCQAQLRLRRGYGGEVQVLFNARYHGKGDETCTMAVPALRTRKYYGLAASFTKEKKDSRQILAVSVKAHSLLGPILLPLRLLQCWAVAGTTAWAFCECNHWRALIAAARLGYDAGSPHQATSFAAPLLESSGCIRTTASCKRKVRQDAPIEK
jgi:hypothetical protein